MSALFPASSYIETWVANDFIRMLLNHPVLSILVAWLCITVPASLFLSRMIKVGRANRPPKAPPSKSPLSS